MIEIDNLLDLTNLRVSLRYLTFAAVERKETVLSKSYKNIMHTKQNLGIERGQCSFYRNVRVKENVLMHISEFVNLIRNGKWKNEVSSYRQLMRDGKTEEAGRIKSNLPAILVAGECEGGHTKANFRKFSGELILDVDGCAEKTRELLHQLKVQP